MKTHYEVLKKWEAEFVAECPHLADGYNKADILEWLAQKHLLQQATVSGSLPLADLETKVEGFIQQHRKICWEAEFEQDEFCVGENRLRDFVRRLKRQ